MNARLSRGGATRLTGLALAPLLFLNLGCGDSGPFPAYEPTAVYPPRADPVVVQLPTSHPTARPAPGKMDEFVRTLPTLGGKVADPAKLPAAKREQLRAALDAIFGTPAEPTVIGADANAVQLLALDPETLKSAAGGFKVRCVQCHGQTGDGRGPNAAFIDPYPRDFRSGAFKRTTGAAHNGKPRVDDIVTTLRSGVKGTSMPMFDLIPPAEVRATAGYVVHLAIRGEVEAEVVKRLLSEGASGYIMKQAAADQLLNALRTVLRGETYLSEALTTTLRSRAGTAQPAGAANPVERLSNRELQVLNLVGRGVSSREIAAELGLSVKTVESHRQSVKRKLNLATNAQLLQYAMNWFAGRRSPPPSGG